MALAFKTDHLAFVTGDTGATVEFYTQVMGWPLVGAHRGTEPDGRRFFMTAFRADGFVIEFEEVDGRPSPPPQAPSFPHLGLDVGSTDEYEQWKTHLDGCGVEYLDLGHDCFFDDPNGVTFQLIVKRDDGRTADERAALAEEMVGEWLAEPAPAEPAPG